MRRDLPLVVRRGVVQLRLLAGVLAVVVAGTLLLGTCALLLTTGQDQARQAHLQRSPDEALTAEVVVGQVPVDAVAAVDAVSGVLTDALAPLPVTLTTWSTSTLRGLGGDAPGPEQLGYLAGISDLPQRAELVAGRWPAAPSATGPWEAVLPERAAQLLGLVPGDQVTLGPGGGGSAPAVPIVLVGTFAVDARDPAWQRDPLGGAGYVARLKYGVWQQAELPAYGPFVVDVGALLVRNGAVGGESGLDQVRVVAHPDVAGASSADLATVRTGLDDARTALPAALAGQDAAARVDAPLARTLADLDGQRAVTGSGVLVVALVGLALAGTALGLAARLVTGRRTAEVGLLTARGASRRQLLGQAATEALTIAAVATAIGVPLSLVLYRGLTRLPRLAAAGLDGPLGVTWPLAGTVVAAAVLLAAVLVVPLLAPAPGGAAVRPARRGAVIRSGADLLLAGLAVLAFLQLRARPATSVDGVDPLLVAAPVLCLLAGAVLALRVLPGLRGLAERTARRSRGLVLPLAAWEVARRLRATGAVFLLALATAAATFGTGYAGTWDTSQAEQAAARVGTDLTVPVTSAPPSAQAAAVADATGGTVSPATVRPVALGSLSVTGNRPPVTRLVAVDTTVAGELLSGRPTETATWAGLTAGLAPEETARGATLTVPAAGPAVVVTGSSATGVLAARPVLVVQDGSGARSTLTGEQVPLDGRPHPVGLRDVADAVPAPGDARTVIGMDLQLVLLDEAGVDPALDVAAAVTVQLELAGTPDGAPDADWYARGPVDVPPVVERPAAALTATGTGATLTVRGDVSLRSLLLEPAQLLVTAYEPPRTVPVLLSRDLADAIGAEVDDEVALQLGGPALIGRVAGVVPYVPSAPSGPGVLADVEALARAMAATGDLRSLTDSWWAGGVAEPAAAAGRLADAGLPGAVTRAAVAAQLRDGPLRVGLPAALWLLVAAAVVLALTGTVVHTVAALEARALEVARLQALGAPRRAVGRAVLVEHTVVTTVAVLLGAGVGALACRFLAPLMTVSDTGAVPVPAPVAQWPWPAEALLVGGLLAGCVALVVPLAGSLVRRAGAEHLRLGDAS